MSFEAKTGDVICRAGRGCKCIHKRNASFMEGQIKGLICAFIGNQGLSNEEALKICSWIGMEVK